MREKRRTRAALHAKAASFAPLAREWQRTPCVVQGLLGLDRALAKPLRGALWDWHSLTRRSARVEEQRAACGRALACSVGRVLANGMGTALAQWLGFCEAAVARREVAEAVWESLHAEAPQPHLWKKVVRASGIISRTVDTHSDSDDW